jgi:Uma2 family endonuclease
MRQDTLAPWAELVPGRGPMTVDDPLALPDDEWMYELVEGTLVRMPAIGGEASNIAMRLSAALVTFAEDRGLGRVTGADGEYDLTQPGDPTDTALAPDLAFVRAERVPPRDSPAYQRAWHLAPDLAVEVASLNQYHPGMAAKVQRYLVAGTRLVWVVWPRSKQVDMWRPGDVGQPTATLGSGDALERLDVLPGFTYPLARLFA